MANPEEQARENIDRLLSQAGWDVQDKSDANILAYRGVAIRNFALKPGHGFAGSLLYVDGRAAGVIEAKREGVMLAGVETQSEKYTQGLPDKLPAWSQPLPFAYESTVIETRFTNRLDPEPRSRNAFASHRTETVHEWIDNIAPSDAEQHRIVAKVVEWTTLCDRLERPLITTQTESRHLVEAVLHETLKFHTGNYRSAHF